MKFLVSLFFMALSATSVCFASTDGPIYEPVPFEKLDPKGVDVVGVVLANPKEFAELMSYGNRLVEVGVQHMAPDYRRYRFLVKQCAIGRGCAGGAYLYVQRFKHARQGGNVSESYQFSLKRAD